MQRRTRRIYSRTSEFIRAIDIDVLRVLTFNFNSPEEDLTSSTYKQAFLSFSYTKAKGPYLSVYYHQ